MNALKRIGLILLGLALLMVGLWGGSYLLQAFPANSDYNFAAFCSASLFCLIGGACFVAAFVDYMT